MTYANDVDPAELAAALRVDVMRLARRLRAERDGGADDLTLTLLAALATLDLHGPLTPGALAALERVQPPSMTRVLAELERRGLVARTPHPTDGRQVLVRTTDLAHERLAADRRRREAWLVDQFAQLQPAELDALRAALPVLERLARA
jgi:DNA-binding MarR family transcriptional regulator